MTSYDKQDKTFEVTWKRKIQRLLGVYVLSLSVVFVSTHASADVYVFHDGGGAAYFTNMPGEGRLKVRLPLKREMPQTKARKTEKALKVFYDTRGADFEPVISSASELFAVDPNLVRAVIKAESNFNPTAVSPKGAMGLMQLMPATAREMGVVDPFDPVDNIHGGVAYLSWLLETLKGDVALALSAYNAGPSRVFGQNRIPPFEETRNYVDTVLNYYKYLKGKNKL